LVRAHAGSSHLLNNFYPRTLGHSPVEDRDLVVTCSQSGLCRNAVNHRVDGVASLLQSAHQYVAKSAIIFGDENPHGPPRYAAVERRGFASLHETVRFEDYGDLDTKRERREVMEHILATWGYLALFAIAALAALGIPLGSELAIGYAGVLASGQLVTGHHDHLQLALVIIVATLGEVAGSSAGYAIGRFGGRSLIDRVGKYVLLTHKDLDRAEAWFARRGEPLVFFGRFIPFVRSFVAIAAGIGEMAFAKFLIFTLAACVIWCGGIASIGYALGSSWHRVITDFSYVGYVAAALVIVIAVALIIHRLRSLRGERVISPDEPS
jgi:membrane protein DedA with SNARE-associated domain